MVGAHDLLQALLSLRHWTQMRKDQWVQSIRFLAVLVNADESGRTLDIDRPRGTPAGQDLSSRSIARVASVSLASPSSLGRPSPPSRSGGGADGTTFLAHGVSPWERSWCLSLED